MWSYSQHVEVTVNGAQQGVPDDCSVTALIALLAIKGRIAVEIDGELIPKSQHAERRLKPGERVEIVHAIGGG